jgi:hypothetical protein
MKNVILFLLLFIFSNSINAQTASINIVNNTDFDIKVRLYGEATASCGAGCNTSFITNSITVPNTGYPLSPTTWGAFTPCGISTGIGWATTSCPVSWCTSLPSDFQWTLAEITIPLATTWPIPFPIYLSPLQPSCFGYGPYVGPYYLSGPPAPIFNSMDFTWISSGGSLANVTIYVNQW